MLATQDKTSGGGGKTKSLNPQSVSSQSMTSFSKSNVNFRGKDKLLKQILAKLESLEKENAQIKDQLNGVLGTSKKSRISEILGISKKSVTKVEESIPEKPVTKVEDDDAELKWRLYINGDVNDNYSPHESYTYP